jgi:hypothetical protein
VHFQKRGLPSGIAPNNVVIRAKKCPAFLNLLSLSPGPLNKNIIEEADD